MLSPEAVLEKQADVHFRRILDEAVVIRQETMETLVLNEVATSLLELCDGKTTLGGVIDKMESEYDTDRETLTRDVMTFAMELVESGLVTEVRGS